MLVFDLIGLMDPRVTLANTKVHLASSNGIEHPLQVYFEGRFDEWQSWQNQRNFQRAFVVSLIQLPERDKWLYVGTYAAAGCEWQETKGEYLYQLDPLTSCAEFEGRLVVSFVRPGRQPYLNADPISAQMTLHEVRAEPMHLEEFPGFKKVDLGWADFEIIVRQRVTSWRTALSNAAGIYLLTDTEAGKLYVGSATGEGGLWARWSEYINGHGENVELRKLIAAGGVERARTFRFSILEIADLHAARDELLIREAHWKNVLLTREHGYNAN